MFARLRGRGMALVPLTSPVALNKLSGTLPSTIGNCIELQRMCANPVACATPSEILLDDGFILGGIRPRRMRCGVLPRARTQMREKTINVGIFP